MKIMSHREYLTCVEYYKEVNGVKEEKKEQKKVEPFFPVDPDKVAKAVWFGRLGVKDEVK